jgi:hypothetical protein
LTKRSCKKSFSDLEYAAKKLLTRRDRFLAEIDQVTPWGKLHEVIEPFYPKVVGAGRPPIGLARMLRMYVAQQCFGLLDDGIEDAIYDSQAIRGFVGIDLNRESAPDATTLLKFRHHVAMKRSRRKALPNNKLGRMREKLEVLKASVRTKVEHPFHVLKNLFRHRKTRYRGLAKNTAQLFSLFGFANRVLAGRRFTLPKTRRPS